MTMLDQMRRHKGWLKWSLGLVVLAFVIFYIPDFLRQGDASAVAGDTVATIEGREITAADFRRTYDVQLQAYRNAYGGNISEQLLKQLGIDQQILAQLVDQQVALVEAERLGITGSDEEVRQRIFSTPAFQENGAFIGEQRYQQLLRSQRPPLSPATFENAVRDEIVVDKLRALLTDWLSITDAEVEREYRARNDKVKLAIVPFMAENFRAAATASDEELGTYFSANQSEFLVPEKRKVRFVQIDIEAIRAKVTVPEANVERAYNENIAQYSTPEQVRASHILLRIEGKDEAAVRAKAEDLVKQARAGADFAALAKANSEDEGSAKNGGDLDFFGRGRMVPEFEQVVFTMEPGQVSEPVKSQFGFHVIKLVDKKPGTMRPLAEVRQQLVDQLAYETAQAQAGDLAQTMASEITRPEDLDRVAARHGLTVQESGFFSRDEQILTLGASPEAVAQAFSMQQGQVSSALRSARGLAFITVTGIQPPTMPSLDEAKDRVREAVIKQKMKELSRQKAVEVAARIKGAADFDRAATAAGAAPKTTELITRDSPIPDLGLAPAITDAAFALPVGAVSDPIATDTGTALVKVLEKQEVTPVEWASNRDMFRNELLNDKRNRFFASYMTKAKQKMTIQLNRETLQRALL
jgi:peptidyl-prolyl cis-trans isomerase D